MSNFILNFKHKLSIADNYLHKIKEKIKVDFLQEELQKYKEIIESPNFWDDIDYATKITKQYKDLELQLSVLNNSNLTLKNINELLLSDLEEDNQENEELFKLISLELDNLIEKLEFEYVKLLFNSDYDTEDAFLEIHAGSGGHDAQDFAQMLLRMYTRWGMDNNFICQVVSTSYSDVGLKSAIVKIMGKYAYGWIKGEEGIHRLVRISPFNSEGKRHTSFVAISIYPAINAEENIEINNSDLKIETYRASGAGGQHVNTTDSAVRITHIPTGMVVQCQMERSQHQNKNTALGLLKAKIRAFNKNKQDKEKQNSYSNKQGIDFGNQVRSYVMNPYTLVKDHRSKVEVSDYKAVLDGNINQFLTAYLNL